MLLLALSLSVCVCFGCEVTPDTAMDKFCLVPSSMLAHQFGEEARMEMDPDLLLCTGEEERPSTNIQVFHAGRNIKLKLTGINREAFSPCQLVLLQSKFSGQQQGGKGGSHSKSDGSLGTLSLPEIVEEQDAPYDTRGYIERSFYTSYPNSQNPPIIYSYSSDAAGDSSENDSLELMVRVGFCTGYSRSSAVLFICVVSTDGTAGLLSEGFRTSRRKPPKINELPDFRHLSITPHVAPIVFQSILDGTWIHTGFSYTDPKKKEPSLNVPNTAFTFSAGGSPSSRGSSSDPPALQTGETDSASLPPDLYEDFRQMSSTAEDSEDPPAPFPGVGGSGMDGEELEPGLLSTTSQQHHYQQNMPPPGHHSHHQHQQHHFHHHHLGLDQDHQNPFHEDPCMKGEEGDMEEYTPVRVYDLQHGQDFASPQNPWSQYQFNSMPPPPPLHSGSQHHASDSSVHFFQGPSQRMSNSGSSSSPSSSASVHHQQDDGLSREGWGLNVDPSAVSSSSQHPQSDRSGVATAMLTSPLDQWGMAGYKGASPMDLWSPSAAMMSMGSPHHCMSGVGSGAGGNAGASGFPGVESGVSGLAGRGMGLWGEVGGQVGGDSPYHQMMMMQSPARQHPSFSDFLSPDYLCSNNPSGLKHTNPHIPPPFLFGNFHGPVEGGTPQGIYSASPDHSMRYENSRSGLGSDLYSPLTPMDVQYPSPHPGSSSTGPPQEQQHGYPHRGGHGGR